MEDPTTIENVSGRISVNIPKSVHRELIELAKEEGVSVSHMAGHLIATRLESMKKPKEAKSLGGVVIDGDFAQWI